MNASASPGSTVTIATRGSPLARVQAALVRDRLARAHPGLDVDVKIVRTSGDRFTDRPLAEVGGKGLFTRAIEDALLAGRADVAVHSMKDLPTVLPDGLVIACVLEREDPRDVLIAREPAVNGLGDLRQGAVLGTASLRRAALALNRRPDLRIILFRGNVGTRLAKLARGEADATFLALAGLRRLGEDAGRGVILEPEVMLPAVGQGAIGIECRAGDERVQGLLAPLDHGPSAARVAAERALLAALDGSCRTPIAALAEIAGDTLGLRGAIVTPDGTDRIDVARSGPVSDAQRMGRDAGEELRRRAGPGFLAAIGG